MKTKFLTTAFIVFALLFIVNSCKNDEDEFSRPLTENDMKFLVLMKDGCVVSSLDNLFYYDENLELRYYIGTDSNNLEQKYDIRNIVPYTKYYWTMRSYDYTKSHDGSKNVLKTYAESEIRSFYYVPEPEIVDLHNVDGDWATVVKWDTEEGGQIHDIKVTMTPDKDCNYDKTPIEVPVGQDSCYISAGDLGNPKYQIYHNWWDEANGKYYEPVVYDYKVTINYDISGDVIPVSATKKGIFLNTDGYVADSLFNVYRYGKIGNRIWLLDDLRGLPSDTLAYYIVRLETGLNVVLYSDYAYRNYKYIIPNGFRLPTYNDWLDLETHFGVTDDTVNINYVTDKQMLYKYIPSGSDISMEKEAYSPHDDIYGHYVGKGTGIRDYLIADNEWKDINNPTVRLEGKGHITGFNAHPAGIPYISDYEKMEIHNPYMGYGVSFQTTSGRWGSYLKIILWSGCDGISKELAEENINNEKDVVYSLYRCVKDE